MFPTGGKRTFRYRASREERPGLLPRPDGAPRGARRHRPGVLARMGPGLDRAVRLPAPPRDRGDRVEPSAGLLPASRTTPLGAAGAPWRSHGRRALLRGSRHHVPDRPSRPARLAGHLRHHPPLPGLSAGAARDGAHRHPSRPAGRGGRLPGIPALCPANPPPAGRRHRRLLRALRSHAPRPGSLPRGALPGSLPGMAGVARGVALAGRGGPLREQRARGHRRDQRRRRPGSRRKRRRGPGAPRGGACRARATW